MSDYPITNPVFGKHPVYAQPHDFFGPFCPELAKGLGVHSPREAGVVVVFFSFLLGAGKFDFVYV